MKVDFRVVVGNDLEIIRNWRNSSLIRDVSYNRDYISAEQHQSWFSNIQGDPLQIHWIIVIENVDAGYVAIKNIDTKNKKCEFASLYIGNPDFLLSGAGALAELKVIDYIFETYPAIDKIYCEVIDSNRKVINLHKRFGFVIEGTLTRHYYVEDKPLNVVLLALFREEWLVKKEYIVKLLNA